MQTTDPDDKRDFGSIFAEWEKRAGSSGALARSIKEKKQAEKQASVQVSEKQLKTEAVLDLHGMTVPEAEKAMTSFIHMAAVKRFRKVLIIHGKGIHSKDPVMRQTVISFLERCPKAGKHGTPSAAEGGSGATWVLIKN